MSDPVRFRIGSKQLDMLITLGNPLTYLIGGGDYLTRRMIVRGLLHEREPGCIAITPYGLRRLADELEAGKVQARASHRPPLRDV